MSKIDESRGIILKYREKKGLKVDSMIAWVEKWQRATFCIKLLLSPCLTPDKHLAPVGKNGWMRFLMGQTSWKIGIGA